MDTKTKLIEAEYITLSTFRKSGKEVSTPVWAAHADGAFYIFSEKKAGKVKRIRNSAKSRIATCTASGKVTGDWVETETTLVNGQKEIELAYKALKAKYGWKLFILDLMSKIAGKYKNRAMLKVVIAVD